MSVSNLFRQAVQRSAREDRSISLYTIYGPNTKDYPGQWVVRQWVVGAFGVKANIKPTLHANLDAARASLPAGLSRLERSPADDPVILETWI